ncbi:MAG: META domain-containing protein [Sphingomonadaceae bacterium]|nr:META domain-containing protein [Sphingomonadaceae bacterium]
MLFRSLAAGAAFAFAMAAPALGATPDAYAKLDRASEAACLKAANLTGATAGPPVRYSDKVMFDARIVEGIWPQPHMKGAKARMLCLYNRKNKRVEVQELAVPPAPVPPVKDVWWRAEDIGGKGIVDRSEVTLMFGSDGKIGGRSGCNGYSANYHIDGTNIKVLPPMIGTKMACAPALMNQEQTYQKLLETAVSFDITPQGMLLVKSADGSTSRFVRK